MCGEALSPRPPPAVCDRPPAPTATPALAPIPARSRRRSRIRRCLSPASYAAATSSFQWPARGPPPPPPSAPALAPAPTWGRRWSRRWSTVGCLDVLHRHCGEVRHCGGQSTANPGLKLWTGLMIVADVQAWQLTKPQSFGRGCSVETEVPSTVTAAVWPPLAATATTGTS